MLQNVQDASWNDEYVQWARILSYVGIFFFGFLPCIVGNAFKVYAYSFVLFCDCCRVLQQVGR